jgi:hypothetical protein
MLGSPKTFGSSAENTPSKIGRHNHGTATFSTEIGEAKSDKINFNELARYVKDHYDLLDVINDNLIPVDLPPNVAPTQQWLKELAEG